MASVDRRERVRSMDDEVDAANSARDGHDDLDLAKVFEIRAAVVSVQCRGGTSCCVRVGSGGQACREDTLSRCQGCTVQSEHVARDTHEEAVDHPTSQHVVRCTEAMCTIARD